METRKQIEEILLNDYGCFDDFTVDKLLGLSFCGYTLIFNGFETLN